MKYENITKEMCLYLCPDLEQELYLGIDFWRTFEIAPEEVGVAEVDIENIKSDFRSQDQITNYGTRFIWRTTLTIERGN